MLDLTAYRHIHCIGIGGIGLSAVAEIFLSRGYWVTGSDMKESDVTERMRAAGAIVFIGHEPLNVVGADLVVFSSAVSRDNPELLAAEEHGIPIVTRAEVLGSLMKEYAHSVAVAGTHGKTTTTSMVSLILEDGGKDPTVLVGGNLDAFNGNVKVGQSSYFVTEACEYMDSFLSLSPRYEIIWNIASDHLDYFQDIDHIVHAFAQFTELVPADGVIIAFDANPFVASILKSVNQRVITFGFNDTCDFYAKDIVFNADGMPAFALFGRQGFLAHLQLSIPGEHNIANALAATACCLDMGVDIQHIVSTLSAFTGTQRRFDSIGTTKNGIRIVDDYAHHPTEIRATLKAAANIPHNRMWCLFQPHTYTRTLALFHEFGEAFAVADTVILAEIYAAREKNIYKISSKQLVAEIKKADPDKDVYFFDSFDEIANFVLHNAEPGDLVLTMGAGDIYKVAELIMEKDTSPQ
jgi:UDP-N-acetylmuramate--alanine ligase